MREASADEQLRVDALRALGVVGRPADPEIEAVARVAATLCGVGTAAVNLLESERQCQYVAVGFEAQDQAREDSLCDTVVSLGTPVHVPDLRADPRFVANPFVTGRIAELRFYAAAPVVTTEGFVLGTLCVFDDQPRTLSPAQRAALVDLAGQVMALLERRRQGAALRESEGRLQALLDHTEAAVYAKDYRPGRDGEYVIANTALAGMLGRSTESLLGSTDLDLHPRTVAEALRAHDRQVLSTGVQRFEETMETPEGELRRYHSTKFPLVDEDGRAYAVAGLSTDLTETLAAKARLEESENRWRALVRLSPEAVLVLQGGLIRFANPAAAQLLGSDGYDALLGAPLSALVLDEAEVDAGQGPRGIGALLVCEIGEVVRDVGLRIRRLDGLVRDVDASGTRVVHEGASALQLVLRDVTAARQAQAALAAAHAEVAERQAFTEALLRSVQVGIVACDADGRLTLFNDMTRGWHGLGPDASLDPRDHAETYHLFAADGTTPLPPDEVPLRRALLEGEVHDAELVIAPHGAPATRVVAHGRALTGPGASPGAPSSRCTT